MSAVAESVVVLAPRNKPGVRPLRARAGSRPLVRLAAFFALGLYGAIRWSRLLHPAPAGRLLALLAMATVVAGGLGPVARSRGRLGLAVAILGAIAVLIAALPIAGVPLSLIVHHHVRAIANGIGQGLGAMPRVLVPYNGIDQWVRVVIVLGAAVLLLDAALILAFASAALGDARRAGAALPLIALAVVPSTLMRPSLPYVHGLLLLVLIVALVWGERLPRGNLVAVASITVAAGGGALALAPALDRHRPLIDYRSLAGAVSPPHVATFDWSQRYGPLVWPQTGREVFAVQARRPDYWKAENLDLFNGTGWAQAPASPSATLPAADPSAVAMWTQRVGVTIKGMRTSDVIAAGFAGAPDHVAAVAGDSAGTWQAATELGPGESYSVATYSPRPSHRQLATTASAYHAEARGPASEAIATYRSMLVPVATTAHTTVPVQVVFGDFHSPTGVQVNAAAPISATGDQVLANSPYARVYALARRLAGGARTPIGFVENVEHHLAHGFAYNENPPVRRYPLASFLLHDRIGYCQQFAGAMALLLRMGGVPARVAVGFTSGSYDRSARQWVVSDLQAHAWVEAWFPRYGWVRFDSTPAVAPARGGLIIPTVAKTAGGAGVITQARRRDAGAPAAGVRAPAPEASAPIAPILVAVVVTLALMLAAMAWRRRAGWRRAPEPDRLLAELVRAFSRSGRPLAPGATLAQLERTFRSNPDAAAYVRALRLARYGSPSEQPLPGQRRALRARLAEGLGIAGKLRALWALPPRPGFRLPARLN